MRSVFLADLDCLLDSRFALQTAATFGMASAKIGTTYYDNLATNTFAAPAVIAFLVLSWYFRKDGKSIEQLAR